MSSPRAASLLDQLRPSGSAPPRFLLSTAHLSEPHELALAALFPGLRSVRHTGVLVPTLRQVFHYFRGNKDEKLLAVLDGEGAVGSATMVFCASRATRSVASISCHPAARQEDAPRAPPRQGSRVYGLGSMV